MLLLKLLLAHIIGDFFTQPKSWVDHKERFKLRSSRLYFHIAIHIILLLILLWDLSLWPIILIIGVSHLIIDGLKLLLQNNKNRRWLFFIDQILHLLVIVTAYIIYTEVKFSLSEFVTAERLTIIIGTLFLTLPTSIVMKNIFSKWDITAITENNESLQDAGKYIGILERVLVFIFILSDHWEAVGFLITAKSVFRFGDLKESKHRKLTEYILIGTLISFGIAILVALLCQMVIL